MRKRRQSTKLIELKNKAKREGWLKWLRQGAGEEADERALLNGCWFSERRGQHFVDYTEQYATLTEGPWKGQPFRLLEWQHNSSMRVFGWLRYSPEWGCAVRRFRYWYEEVPKKNGKTPFIATVGNYLLTADSHGRQINVHLAATTRKQAERCLLHAVRQARNHPELAGVVLAKKLEGFYSLQYGDNVWTVLAADPESADGVNGHCLADELHRWKGFEFYNALRWMLASQPEGLFVGITTAGNTFDSVCRTLHEKTKAVNSGTQTDESFFGEIFAADPEDDPHDEKTWFKANPSLGTTRDAPLKLSTFRQDYEAAKLDPAQWPAWRQLRLNVWRTAEEAWIPIEKWDAGQAARRKTKQRIDCYEEFTAEQLAGRTCFGAFDGAVVHDTTAFIFAFPDETEDELVRVLPFYWLPEAEAHKQQAKVPYQHWAEKGFIKLTPGNAVDFRLILQDLVKLFELFDVQQFRFDPLFQAEWLTQELSEATGVPRIEFPQTITYFAAPTAATERLIHTGKLRHNGHPILTWQLGHTTVRTDSNQNKRPVKPKHGDYRTIDGVVAKIMAMKDAIAAETGSYYDDNDVEFV